MSSSVFASPVTVLVGLGFPIRIRHAGAAVRFLQEYPSVWRDLAWEATIETCRQARDGKADIGEARDVFVAFARRRGFLVEDTTAPEVQQVDRVAA